MEKFISRKIPSIFLCVSLIIGTGCAGKERVNPSESTGKDVKKKVEKVVNDAAVETNNLQKIVNKLQRIVNDLKAIVQTIR